MGSIDEYNQRIKISRYCPFKWVYSYLRYVLTHLRGSGPAPTVSKSKPT
jgi:hypothetical protein